MVTDPVCGMRFEEKSAAANATFEGQPYYFCCTGCRDKFAASPALYLNKTELEPISAKLTYRCPMHPDIQQSTPGKCSSCGMALQPEHARLLMPASRPAAGGAQYTCPMHAEIVRDAPGDCPICGMALVPIPGTGEADDTELRDLTRRFWIGT